MTKKQRYKIALKYFAETMPIVATELNFSSPFQLLIAVILSAQCTDKRVNIITEKLFERYPDAPKMSHATHNEIFQLISSCTYPNSKANYLIETSKIITEKFSNVVPISFEDLLILPGVGRKTANVILSVLFREPKMPVDTHVFRVSKRLGLVRKDATLLQTERELVRNIPKDIIPDAHHWLILFGRNTCTARNPKCDTCSLISICTIGEKKVEKSEKII